MISSWQTTGQQSSRERDMGVFVALQQLSRWCLVLHLQVHGRAVLADNKNPNSQPKGSYRGWKKKRAQLKIPSRHKERCNTQSYCSWMWVSQSVKPHMSGSMFKRQLFVFSVANHGTDYWLCSSYKHLETQYVNEAESLISTGGVLVKNINPCLHRIIQFI